MDKNEHFAALEALHLKLWTLERYIREGDLSAEGLYKKYIEMLKQLIRKSEEDFN